MLATLTAPATQSQLRKIRRQIRDKKLTHQDWWKTLEDQREFEPGDETVKLVINNELAAERRLQDYKNSPRYRYAIRKYANLQYPNDCYPYEVIRVVNAKTVIVREMDAKIVTQPKEFHPGGFCGHFSDNYAQTWECTSNPNNKTKRIHLGKYGWAGGSHYMSDTPIKFYDFNL